MVKAMYAFSGDPITYGHIDVISRVSKLFDKLIVGIGVNPDKKYTFTLEERTDMAKKSLVKFPNVEVVAYPGLLVDYAYENGVKVVIRGVRNAADLDFETNLHWIGKSQKLDVETFQLFARPELAHVSSSAVKGIQKEQGLIQEYVPLYVKQKLEEKISGQYILGITGEMGCGKSYVSKKFVEFGEQTNLKVHNIELDYLGHQILGELKQPKYEEVRQEIENVFGNQVRNADGSINRKELGNIVFNDADSLKKLNQLMATPLLVRLRRELYGKKGLILFNAALIAESDMSYLCNNNVVLIYADKSTQENRLNGRGLNSEQIQRRLKTQFDFNEKRSRLEQAIEKDNNGKIWTINNSEGMGTDESLKSRFEEVINDLKLK